MSKCNVNAACCNTSTVPPQVTSLFKPSSKRSNDETSTTHGAPQAGGQPLSYAEFVVQSKSRAKEKSGHGPQTGENMPAGQRTDCGLECGSITKPSTDTGKTQTSTKEKGSPVPAIAGSESSVPPGRLEEDLAPGQKMDEGQSTEERTVVTPAIGSGNSIIVSPRQVQKRSGSCGIWIQ